MTDETLHLVQNAFTALGCLFGSIFTGLGIWEQILKIKKRLK